MYIICSVTQQIKKLRIHNCHKEIKRIVRIRNNNKHCSSLISQHIQFQLIIRSQLPQFCNIKWCQPCPTGNQNRFRSLSGSQLIFLVLSDCKMLWFFLFQFLKQFINCIFKFFIIFPCLRSIDKFQKRGKILFFFRRFVIDIPN